MAAKRRCTGSLTTLWQPFLRAGRERRPASPRRAGDARWPPGPLQTQRHALVSSRQARARQSSIIHYSSERQKEPGGMGPRESQNLIRRSLFLNLGICGGRFCPYLRLQGAPQRCAQVLLGPWHTPIDSSEAPLSWMCLACRSPAIASVAWQRHSTSRSRDRAV